MAGRKIVSSAIKLVFYEEKWINTFDSGLRASQTFPITNYQCTLFLLQNHQIEKLYKYLEYHFVYMYPCYV